ncbi:6254_t:CDS:2, partial [Acaulospora morrowiae]
AGPEEEQCREAVMAVITIVPLIPKKPTKLGGTEPTIKPYLPRRTSNSMDDELRRQASRTTGEMPNRRNRGSYDEQDQQGNNQDERKERSGKRHKVDSIPKYIFHTKTQFRPQITNYPFS